jgi:hypothetical protein
MNTEFGRKNLKEGYSFEDVARRKDSIKRRF